MKKILIVYTHTVHGGGEVLLLRILSGINKTKFAPFIVISRRNARLAGDLTKLGIPFAALADINVMTENKLFKAIVQGPNFLWLNLATAWFILRYRPAVVHAGMFYSALFSIVPSKLLGRRFIWPALSLNDLVRYPMISGFLMRFADKTMLPCRDFVRVAKEHNLPGVEKMEVIYTGMREEEFAERITGSILEVNGYSIKRPIVALVARYDEAQKGHKYFWEMAKAVHARFPNANFVIAGGVSNDIEKEFKSRLDAMTVEAGLDKNLFCVGLVKDIQHFLSYADVVVISSVYEAPSAVAQEAGAAMKPVVAFRTGGIPEVVNDGEGGFLVPFPDVAALTEKVMLLLGDPKLAEKMGRQGHMFVHEHFREAQFIASYERVYATITRS